MNQLIAQATGAAGTSGFAQVTSLTYDSATNVVDVRGPRFTTDLVPDLYGANGSADSAAHYFASLWVVSTSAPLPSLRITFTDIGTTYTCPASVEVQLSTPTGSLAATAVPAACPISGTPPPTPAAQMGMTLAHFNQITSGMSYEQVEGLVGSPGTLLAESNVAGYDTKIYMWNGTLGGNANVTFQNDQEVDKAQFGLS